MAFSPKVPTNYVGVLPYKEPLFRKSKRAGSAFAQRSASTTAGRTC